MPVTREYNITKRFVLVCHINGFRKGFDTAEEARLFEPTGDDDCRWGSWQLFDMIGGKEVEIDI